MVKILLDVGIHDYLHSRRHTLLKGVRYFMSVVSILIVRFGQNSVPEIISVKLFVKIGEGRVVNF
jgi:hypothetical protein